MNSNLSYIKAAELFLPLGNSLESVFDNILDNKVAYKEKSLPSGEQYPCMVWDNPVSINEGCIAVINSLKQKLKIEGFDENTQLIFTTTKGDIDAKTMAEKMLWASAKSIAQQYNLKPEPIVISTACISGVSGVGLGADLLNNGAASKVLVVGADKVSDFVLSGFSSFKALSSSLCKPYSAERDGLNLGEGFAAIYMENDAINAIAEVVGFAQSNDANHISGPSRDGDGLQIAIRNALLQSNLEISIIDAVSSHGTATNFNDEMESLAYQTLQIQSPVTSFKCFTGHTLGAAGVIEVALCLEAMKRNIWPTHREYYHRGVSGHIRMNKNHSEQKLDYVLKTASGFGGCNAAIILKKLS